MALFLMGFLGSHTADFIFVTNRICLVEQDGRWDFPGGLLDLGGGVSAAVHGKRKDFFLGMR